MLRTVILGAVAAATIGLAVPARAHMANPTMGVTTPGNIQHAQYYYRRHHHWRRPYWRGYAYYPRRCWTERIRTWDGYVRYVRRCR